MTDKPFPQPWKPLLAAELEKEYFKYVRTAVRDAYATQSIFPEQKNLFRALALCPPEKIKVVILGQDPYHTPGVADGLAFSTLPKNKIPPSLLNIFKEVASEYGADNSVSVNRDPDLTRWATQGVLLLNASLSVRSGEANSHADFGWHIFTDAIISTISHEREHVVFILWGAFAGKKVGLIDQRKHLVLTAVHPSPLSAHRGFFGCGHFKTANEYLKVHGLEEIVWI